MNKTLLVVGAVLAIGIMGLMFYKIKDNTASYYQEQKAIDSLAVVISTLKKQELQIDSTLLVYKKNVDKLNVTVARDKKDLEEIKKQQHEKIDSIRSYNATQLDSFFTNRYHYSLPTNNGSKTDSH